MRLRDQDSGPRLGFAEAVHKNESRILQSW